MKCIFEEEGTLDGKSLNIVNDKLKQLKAILPEALEQDAAGVVRQRVYAQRFLSHPPAFDSCVQVSKSFRSNPAWQRQPCQPRPHQFQEIPAFDLASHVRDYSIIRTRLVISIFTFKLKDYYF